MMKNAAVLLTMPAVVMSHMGVSSPKPWDHGAGDSYRNPNPGAMCHGQTGGGDKLSGPTVLKMSGGAAHGGGPCVVFYCPKVPASTGTCTRDKVNPVEGCTIVVETRDCSTKGAMDSFDAKESTGIYLWYWNPGFNSGTCEIYQNCWTANGAGGAPPAPPPTMPSTVVVAPPGGTASKVRCGTSWGAADKACGKTCSSDADCPGESCFADLRDCAGGGTGGGGVIAPPPVRPIGPDTTFACVSTQPHITDAFCRGVGCSTVYRATCQSGGLSQQAPGLVNPNCSPYAVNGGETWQDVAAGHDIVGGLDALKAMNPNAGPVLYADQLIEFPGDCAMARSEAGNELTGDASSLVIGAAAMVLGVAALF